MNRREFLRRTAAVVGGVAVAQVVAPAESVQPTEPRLGFNVALSEELLADAIVDVWQHMGGYLLPQEDIPSMRTAIDTARVAEYQSQRQHSRFAYGVFDDAAGRSRARTG